MKRAALALFCLALASCSGGESREDLSQWMRGVAKDTKEKGRGKPPPLPTQSPYTPTSYGVANQADPFSAAKLVSARKKAGGQGPDTTRAREPLESYPLESIKFVGVMTQKNISYAILQVEGALYQLKTGNYMGPNFGKITKISELEIVLEEQIESGVGDWESKTSTLTLQGNEVKK